MDLAKLVFASLVVWRLSSLISSEEGPFAIFERFRGIYKQDSILDRLVSCLWCLSVWVSFPVASIVFWPDPLAIILGWLASSAGAILVEGIVGYEEE